MKRILIMLLGFCLLLSACAPVCILPMPNDGGVTASEAPEAAPTAEATPTAEPTPTPDPTAEMQGDLEYFILHGLSDTTLSGDGFTEVGGMFGGSMFIPSRYEAETNEYGVINSTSDLPAAYVLYTVTGYPDVLDSKWCVTGIKITDPAVHVFGITTRATAEEFMAAVEKFGLKAAPPEDMDAERIERLDYARAVSPDGTWYVSIWNTDGLRTISFYAPTTNEWGVMF